ncbi:MAG: hypothetical protein NTZ37_05305 [Methanoregula sp.]|nr:hypothetical protein [Methanoregula sp.]
MPLWVPISRVPHNWCLAIETRKRSGSSLNARTEILVSLGILKNKNVDGHYPITGIQSLNSSLMPDDQSGIGFAFQPSQ